MPGSLVTEKHRCTQTYHDRPTRLKTKGRTDRQSDGRTEATKERPTASPNECCPVGPSGTYYIFRKNVRTDLYERRIRIERTKISQ